MMKSVSRVRIVLFEPDDVDHPEVSQHLTQIGWHVRRAKTENQGVELLTQAGHDIIVVGKYDFSPEHTTELITHITAIREASPQPLIVVAKNDLNLRLECYKAGADDIFDRNFNIELLAAKIEACMRWIKPDSEAVPAHVAVQDITDRITLNRFHRFLLMDGERVKLSPCEYKILEKLAAHAGTMVPLQQLYAFLKVEPTKPVSLQIALATQIYRLRQKISPTDHGLKGDEIIKSVRSKGYRLASFEELMTRPKAAQNAALEECAP